MSTHAEAYDNIEAGFLPVAFKNGSLAEEEEDKHITKKILSE